MNNRAGRTELSNWKLRLILRLILLAKGPSNVQPAGHHPLVLLVVVLLSINAVLIGILVLAVTAVVYLADGGEVGCGNCKTIGSFSLFQQSFSLTVKPIPLFADFCCFGEQMAIAADA